MKKNLCFGVVLLITTWLFCKEPYFLSHPVLTPDAEKIVFSYDGDLWIVSSPGGQAYRITAMEGEESRARISPDGRWVAFSGNQTGNRNIYIMPLRGGEIRQLTFYESEDLMDSWSWDSKHLYFTSNRYNNFTAYRISREGGTPVRLFKNYFNTPHGLVEHPRSKAYYFTDTWESLRFANRKGYRGDYNPDIKMFNPETGEFKILTSYRGKDFQPIFDGKGHLYFISDEANGEYNLYTFKKGKKQQLTHFSRSVMNPQASANGEKVVFEKDYQIFVYDVGSGETGKIPIQLLVNDTLSLDQDFNLKGKVTYFDISPDGKKMALVSRGELLVSDIQGKFIKKIKTDPLGRVMEVKWLKDNQTILFNQTVDGWLNLFKIKGDGTGREKQLTRDTANNRCIQLNTRRTGAAYYSGRDGVRLLDLTTFKSDLLFEEELWALYNPPPVFSPDDRYIAVVARNNFESDIIIHDLKKSTTRNITDSGISETQPFWSPDGRYLYFCSDRFHPVYPRGGDAMKIYRFPLQKRDGYYRLDRFKKLFVEENKKENKKKETVTTPVVKIDFRDIVDRWEQVSPDTGSQHSPHVIQEKEKSHVLYVSDHDGGKSALWKTTIEPFKKNKTQKITGGKTRELAISGAQNKFYVLVNGSVNKLDLNKNSMEPIKMDFSIQRNLRDEFRQMFYEVWANLKENFYDEKFHGKDWRKIRQYYQTFLPHLNTRADLRRLLSDMLGELNSSHLGFYSRGKEEKTFHRRKTMATGIVFSNENPYTVDRIIKNSPADKEHIDLKPGDILTAINGNKIDTQKNREYYFATAGFAEEFLLNFKRGERDFEVKIHPQSPGQFRNRLYDEWVANNQNRVDEKSQNRIAYIQMKNMGGKALEDFIIEMTTEWYRKEALILDLRYNTGGNVHDAVLQFLSQRPYTLWKYRGGEYCPQPHFAPSGKPIVLLINEQSLSDAEMTTAGFKALGLGTVIGTETYRWVIFTTGKRLVDGSYYRLPSWGCFTLDKKDIERTGVKPDIYIKNSFKDRLERRDPQLDRAIQEILKQLEPRKKDPQTGKQRPD